MATIKGTKAEIKPGFSSITYACEEGKVIAFYNSTQDIQFNICYTMTEPQVEVLGDTQDGGDGKYALAVYPGETKEFVKGKWKGYKRSLSFGAPEQAWRDKQVALRNEEIENEIIALKELVKQHPRADGKYTAEYIADLCIQHNVKFVDITFPPRSASIARDWEPQIGPYEWCRPESYCSEAEPPAVFVNVIEPNDIDQGTLGDCYFLCALACIAEFPHLVKDAFSLKQHPELGIYRVLVCKNGWWQVVVIDDYLPCTNRKPCFAKNREEPNELWVSLFEKAYAKLHGSFVAIKSGDTPQSITDVLGAPFYKLKTLPEFMDKEQLFKLLLKSDEDEHLMSLSTPKANPENNISEQYEEVNLLMNHSYSLLTVRHLQHNGNSLRLCKIRNPWGNDKEWNGAWSDDSPMWTEELMAEVGFEKADDGTFWMEWGDVVKYFENGSLSKVMREWPQLKVSGNIEEGCSDLVVELCVTKDPIECYFGVHQRDNRGLPTGDKDGKYQGFLLSVVTASPQGAGSIVVGETNGGSFNDSRENFAFVTLQPQEAPYYVLVQPFSPEISKSFTLSMTCDKPQALQSIKFKSYGGTSRRYVPASRFVATDVEANAAPANYQVRVAKKNDEGMMLFPRQGEAVDLKILCGDADPATAAGQRPPAATTTTTPANAGASKSATAAAPPAGAEAAGASPPQQQVQEKKADTAATKPQAAPRQSLPPKVAQPANTSQKPVSAAAIAPAKGVAAARGGNLKLQLIVIEGRGLVAKDSNGLSDPYVTIKLKNAQGQKLPQDQRQESRYIKETLNPVWCDVFRFNCNPQDVICIKVWDKDMFGHDAMGEINLPVNEAVKSLIAGGSAVLRDLPLQSPPKDASGSLLLGFSLLI